MSGPNHTGAFERRVRALCEGFRRDFPPSAERVRFGGRTMTMAEVIATLEDMEGAFEAVHHAERRYRQALSDRRRSISAHRSTYEDAVFFLKHCFGKGSPRLVEFGVAPPRARRALSAEANAIARAKAAATRKARGTLGRRQRQARGKSDETSLVVFGPDGVPLDSSGGAATAAEPTASSEAEPPGAA